MISFYSSTFRVSAHEYIFFFSFFNSCVYYEAIKTYLPLDTGVNDAILIKTPYIHMYVCVMGYKSKVWIQN